MLFGRQFLVLVENIRDFDRPPCSHFHIGRSCILRTCRYRSLISFILTRTQYRTTCKLHSTTCKLPNKYNILNDFSRGYSYDEANSVRADKVRLCTLLRISSIRSIQCYWSRGQGP